jgi:LacI family transcriptional regulator/LacI family repressor for deo operon, udp, cdd, tsx, nupC, and nupG
MLYAKSKGIRIPRDLGVVGFSNDPMASVIEPSLTTVEQPVAEMGREAMRILLDAVKKGLNDFIPVRTALQTRLIVRQSSVRK